MKKKEKLLQELINSLLNESENWRFGEYTANNIVWGIELWIANIPILDLCVHRPTKINFSFRQRIKLLRAMKECRASYILKLNSSEKTRV